MWQSIFGTMDAYNTKIVWFENKHPDRVKQDQEKVRKLLLSVPNEEQMEYFIHRCFELLRCSVRIEDKYYLIVDIVKDQKLIDYMNSPPEYEIDMAAGF
jgi:hypothetical protein